MAEADIWKLLLEPSARFIPPDSQSGSSQKLCYFPLGRRTARTAWGRAADHQQIYAKGVLLIYNTYDPAPHRQAQTYISSIESEHGCPPALLLVEVKLIMC